MGEYTVTWNQKYTDFIVVLQSGQQLKCHKSVLAYNSDVLEAMLENDLLESKTGQMKFNRIDDQTVVSFMEYIYASSLDAEIKDRILPSGGLLGLLEDFWTKGFVPRRSFKKEKLTWQLLEMAHMYHVVDLEEDCADHLTMDVTDNNVMVIWKNGERFESKILTSAATKYLVKRTNKISSLSDIPGFDEGFNSLGKPQLKKLVKEFFQKVKELSGTQAHLLGWDGCEDQDVDVENQSGAENQPGDENPSDSGEDD